MLRKYTKKMFLEYASAFDYYDEMKETMQSWSLRQFQEFYDFTHYDWESGKQLKPNRKKNNMKKTYQFDVPCVYYYEINADTEEQARKILLDKGGLDIDGDLCLDEDNYKRAELVGILQK